MPRSRPSFQSEPSNASQSNVQLSYILESSNIDSSVISQFYRVHQLSRSVQRAISHRHTQLDSLALEEDAITIQRDILEHLISKSHNLASHRACIFGMLLYLRTIARPSASWAQSSKLLVDGLKRSIENYYTRISMDSRLVKWLLLLGFMTSIEATTNRIWFLNILREFVSQSVDSPSAWHDVAIDLDKISWIPEIHDNLGKAHWEAVTTT
jgi:hypothetical protein